MTKNEALEDEMDLNTASPVEFDTEYAAQLRKLAVAGASRDRALESLHAFVGDDGKYQYIGRKSYRIYELKADAVLERARSGDFRPAYNRSGGEAALTRYETAKAMALELAKTMDTMDAVFRARGGWSRFFLVTGGHIHSSLHCSTCHKNGNPTSMGWLPALSGLTEAEAVAEHGAILCTVCFPSAPVEWTNKYELDAEAKKASQCAGSGTFDWEKAAKDAGRVPNYNRKYQQCPHCLKTISITSTGKLRAHK